MIEEQCEHIIALCETYVEGDRLEDVGNIRALYEEYGDCLLYTSPSPRDATLSRMPSSA